jgi:hypothetical protein
MIESPLIAEVVSRFQHKALLRALKAKFGPVPAEVMAAIEAIEDPERLEELIEAAAVFTDLDAFRKHLSA